MDYFREANYIRDYSEVKERLKNLGLILSLDKNYFEVYCKSTEIKELFVNLTQLEAFCSGIEFERGIKPL